MSYAESSASDHEQVILRFNLSWWIQGLAIVTHVFLFLVLLVPTGGLSIFMFVFTAWDLIDRYFTEYVVTTRRVIYRRGIIRRITREIDTSAVESVDLQQSILGRILGYGSLSVRGRGTVQADFLRVGGVVSVRRAIQNSVDSR